MEAYISNFIRVKNFGICRVINKHHSCPDIPDKPIDKRIIIGQWYDVLVNGGGSILIPESDIEYVYDVECAAFRNTMNSFYFGV